jgi:hypothetical protein
MTKRNVHIEPEDRVHVFDAKNPLGTADDLIDELVNTFDGMRLTGCKVLNTSVGSRFEARVRELQRLRREQEANNDREGP